MNVAVDAMGGDCSTETIVQGAIQAASEFDIDVTLVGDGHVLTDALASQPCRDRMSFRHCSEVVDMDESPLKAVRKKKDSSINVAFGLLKSGVSNAVVSAGNSGATLAAAVLALGRLNGVDRPGIASFFPGEDGPVLLIDVGANVDCRPRQLFQFGIMAQAFICSCLEIEDPKIGLLSIGEEDKKGNEQVLSTRHLFEQSPLNFVGNVEGRDIFSGNIQIIVCDGFVGNVALKLSEGMAQTMIKMLDRELRDSYRGKIARFLGDRKIKQFIKTFEYEEYGGAPLLGVNGVGIVCHGRSSERAIKNAIILASQYASKGTLKKMASQLTESNEQVENI
jgi:glycerol-3-phosphate acyltransferase PlsX